MLAEGSLECPCWLRTKYSINSLGLRKLEENRMSYDLFTTQMGLFGGGSRQRNNFKDLGLHKGSRPKSDYSPSIRAKPKLGHGQLRYRDDVSGVHDHLSRRQFPYSKPLVNGFHGMVGVLLLADVTEENSAMPADVRAVVNAGRDVGNLPRRLPPVEVPELA